MFSDKEIRLAVTVTTNHGKELAYAYRILAWLADNVGYVESGDFQGVVRYLEEHRIDHAAVKSYSVKGTY